MGTRLDLRDDVKLLTNIYNLSPDSTTKETARQKEFTLLATYALSKLMCGLQHFPKVYFQKLCFWKCISKTVFCKLYFPKVFFHKVDFSKKCNFQNCIFWKCGFQYFGWGGINWSQTCLNRWHLFKLCDFLGYNHASLEVLNFRKCFCLLLES